MSQEPRKAVDDARQWWLSISGTPEGPHSESYILAGLKTGKISTSAYACPVGGQQWKSLKEWPVFAGACEASFAPPPPPPPAPNRPTPPSTSQKVPWNPRTIGLLGLLFSPVWAGIMAALNARRLHMKAPVWRPITIGIGVTVLDIVVSMVIGDNWFLDLFLYLGGLGLIWHLDLNPQLQTFVSRKPVCDRKASWLVPALAGSPVGFLVVLAFLIVPLLPLGPREVCQKFLATETADEAKQYVTANMYPLIEQFKRMESLAKQLPEEELPEDDYDMFELTDEADAPPDMRGYLVGCRTFIPDDAGDSLLMDGFLHLTNLTGDWKIDGWYITYVNGESVDQGSVTMTEFFKGIADEMQKEVDKQGRLAHRGSRPKYDYSMYNYGRRDAGGTSETGSSRMITESTGRASQRSQSHSSSVASVENEEPDARDGTSLWLIPRLLFALKGMVASGGAKKLGALLLAALAGLAGAKHWLTGSDSNHGTSP